jgi:hypothetical protein
MKPLQLFGVILLIAGLLALAYGGFTYTKQTHDVKLGPLEMQVNEKQHVNVPLWAGIAMAVGGGVLLASGNRVKI